MCTDLIQHASAFRSPGVQQRNLNVHCTISFSDCAALDGKTLAQWQAMDPAENDVGSTYKDVSVGTQADEIIAAARELLSM